MLSLSKEFKESEKGEEEGVVAANVLAIQVLTESFFYLYEAVDVVIWGN